jgi:DAPG hydrolase PhiG domain
MFRRRLLLPPPRKLPWPLKPLDSAQTSLSYDEFGRMVMRIRHDVLKGLTPEMLAWWFGNISGDMQVDEKRLNRYLAWHPQDHILWELAHPGPDGGASVGAKFHIVEAFGRNPDFYVDVIDTVTRLDATGFTAVSYILGQQVSHLNHDFTAVDGGTLYVSSLTIGTIVPILSDVLNPLIHRTIFPEAMGRAWLKHNIEEVGLLEHIIPLLHRATSESRRRTAEAL